MATTSLPSKPEAVTVQITPRFPAAGRLISLDVFRGMTIAGMILVNNPGTWDAIYWPLRHAEWHGWTPTDLIFPFFLFIVGVSMVFSFEARQARGASRGELMRHAIWRSFIILVIAYLLRGFPFRVLATMRIPGVLQRISVVYLLGSWVYLYVGRRGRIAITAALLLGYWAAMMLVPVPRFGAGNLTADGNLASFIDRQVMYEHLWVRHRWDPEGLLSTFPAVATTLIGVFVGEWLRSARSAAGKLGGLLGAGAAGLLAGELWNLWFPINKNLWTSSYVLFTGGFAMVLLAICYWLVEIKGWRKWGVPFVWFGSNAITVYAASEFTAELSDWVKVGSGGYRVSLHGLVYDKVFAPLAQPVNASLLFATSYVLIFMVLVWIMYKRKIFIKV